MSDGDDDAEDLGLPSEIKLSHAHVSVKTHNAVCPGVLVFQGVNLGNAMGRAVTGGDISERGVRGAG